MKPGAPVEASDKLKSYLEKQGVTVDLSRGTNYCILGAVGDTSGLDPDQIMVNEWVERVVRITEPYKCANKVLHPGHSIIDVSGVPVGGRQLAMIAGPCSLESAEQVDMIAAAVKKSGANMLRGSVFKSRTSPYAFQGLRDAGLEMLYQAGKKNHLPIVTEIMSVDKLEKFVDKVDLIQVGARSMQNFTLLKELGKIDKPILLKRGISATVEEWLLAAEYIMSRGNEKVILCERGIRSFETMTRNTLDLSAVLAVKQLSQLPVLVDPSRATGIWWMVESLAKAAVLAGADGLMIDVHNDPENARSDGSQSLKPERFAKLMQELKAFAKIAGREI